MARGDIFYIATNKDVNVTFDEADFYENLESFHLDYVENKSVYESEISLNLLKEFFTNLGAVIGGQEGDFSFSFTFTDANAARRTHFAPKLKEFKKQAESLTLENVMLKEPCLAQLLNDEYRDIVTLNNEVYDEYLTMDDFIRKIRSGAKYYVYHRVILMH